MAPEKRLLVSVRFKSNRRVFEWLSGDAGTGVRVGWWVNF